MNPCAKNNVRSCRVIDDIIFGGAVKVEILQQRDLSPTDTVEFYFSSTVRLDEMKRD
jgi:hypothetical protein